VDPAPGHPLVARHLGFEILRGHARFTGADRLNVDGREVVTTHAVIATGAAPWSPPIQGLRETGHLTSTTAMELAELPESLVVIGGNYIGLELGQVFANLGSKVTIVEVLDRIAPLEEPEISEAMTRILEEQGVRVVTSATVTRVEAGPPRTVVAETGNGELRLSGTEILVATGRRPVLDGLDLEEAGIELDERGGLVLDGSLRTTNPNVFAAGDVTGARGSSTSPPPRGPWPRTTPSPERRGTSTSPPSRASRSRRRASRRWDSPMSRPSRPATGASAGSSSSDTSRGLG
jgi:mercuric reductase